MKKIINGKKYDTTTTAKVVGCDYASGMFTNDFGFWRETLYVKSTGEFFLHGEGGGLTEYASSCGNSRSWGERIIPFTEEQAKRWAEQHLDAEDYEQLFGPVAE